METEKRGAEYCLLDEKVKMEGQRGGEIIEFKMKRQTEGGGRVGRRVMMTREEAC